MYACQHFWLGEVDKSSGAYTTQLSFSKVEDFVRCEGAAEVCKTQLCKDYCGPGHFAAAPVCAAYDEPECGKPVAVRDGASLGITDAGMPSAGGKSSPQSMAAGKAAQSGGRGAAGQGVEEPRASSSSGCACSAVGVQAGGAWLLLLAWPLLRVRRRRN